MPSPGVTTLSQLTLAAQYKADMVNANFLSSAEWTYNINQSITELYDLLTTKYEFYYVKLASSTNGPSYSFTTDGTSQIYTLPTDFYKLYGVDLALFGAPFTPSFISLRSFPFGERNKYAIPNYQTYFGVTNLQYCLITGNPGALMFIPIPQANQTINVWYAPRFTPLVNPTDTFDGINGYEELVAIDAAIKALQKEESDVSTLMAQKAAMIKRIEDTASNRDAGAPAHITDVNYNQGGYPGGSWSGSGSI
jgi:hypothetical protein